MRGLLIKDGKAILVEKEEFDLETMYELIECDMVETVHVHRSPDKHKAFVMFCDEEGKIKKSRPLASCVLARAKVDDKNEPLIKQAQTLKEADLLDIVLGPMLVLGFDDNTGENIDLCDAALSEFKRNILMPEDLIGIQSLFKNAVLPIYFI